MRSNRVFSIIILVHTIYTIQQYSNLVSKLPTTSTFLIILKPHYQLHTVVTDIQHCNYSRVSSMLTGQLKVSDYCDHLIYRVRSKCPGQTRSFVSNSLLQRVWVTRNDWEDFVFFNYASLIINLNWVGRKKSRRSDSNKQKYLYIYKYIKQSRFSYTFYHSRLAEPFKLKIRGEIA